MLAECFLSLLQHKLHMHVCLWFVRLSDCQCTVWLMFLYLHKSHGCDAEVISLETVRMKWNEFEPHRIETINSRSCCFRCIRWLSLCGFWDYMNDSYSSSVRLPCKKQQIASLINIEKICLLHLVQSHFLCHILERPWTFHFWTITTFQCFFDVFCFARVSTERYRSSWLHVFIGPFCCLLYACSAMYGLCTDCRDSRSRLKCLHFTVFYIFDGFLRFSSNVFSVLTNCWWRYMFKHRATVELKTHNLHRFSLSLFLSASWTCSQWLCPYMR